MGKIQQFIREYGFIKSFSIALDSIFYRVNKFFRGKLYRWTKDDFGLKETLFWSKDIALYLRYSKVLNELKNIISNANKKISILEVGAGGEGIARFLKYSGDYEKCDIQLADTNVNALRNIKLGNPVEIEGDDLPFEDSAFDVVISINTLEHIP